MNCSLRMRISGAVQRLAAHGTAMISASNLGSTHSNKRVSAGAMTMSATVAKSDSRKPKLRLSSGLSNKRKRTAVEKTGNADFPLPITKAIAPTMPMHQARMTDPSQPTRVA
ncbi:hypothetical protein GCM10009567_06460 [Rothia amarae]